MKSTPIRKTTVEIPDELHRRVKLKAYQEGKTIASVVRTLLEEWVR